MACRSRGAIPNSAATSRYACATRSYFTPFGALPWVAHGVTAPAFFGWGTTDATPAPTMAHRSTVTKSVRPWKFATKEATFEPRASPPCRTMSHAAVKVSGRSVTAASHRACTVASPPGRDAPPVAYSSHRVAMVRFAAHDAFMLHAA